MLTSRQGGLQGPAGVEHKNAQHAPCTPSDLAWKVHLADMEMISASHAPHTQKQFADVQAALRSAPTKVCQPRDVLKNEATSSKANKRPPMGALKATATPMAEPVPQPNAQHNNKFL